MSGSISFDRAAAYYDETLADSSLTGAYARWVLHLVPEWMQALRELDRTVVPGGKVAIEPGGFSGAFRQIYLRYRQILGDDRRRGGAQLPRPRSTAGRGVRLDRMDVHREVPLDLRAHRDAERDLRRDPHEAVVLDMACPRRRPCRCDRRGPSMGRGSGARWPRRVLCRPTRRAGACTPDRHDRLDRVRPRCRVLRRDAGPLRGGRAPHDGGVVGRVRRHRADPRGRCGHRAGRDPARRCRCRGRGIGPLATDAVEARGQGRRGAAVPVGRGRRHPYAVPPTMRSAAPTCDGCCI